MGLAVARRHVAVARLLLEKGANVDYVDSGTGEAPLHVAARLSCA